MSFPSWRTLLKLKTQKEIEFCVVPYVCVCSVCVRMCASVSSHARPVSILHESISNFRAL